MRVVSRSMGDARRNIVNLTYLPCLTFVEETPPENERTHKTLFLSSGSCRKRNSVCVVFRV